MKKIFVLSVIVSLLTLSVPSFAANPFMDVPMGHWAYDAVLQLAASGVVSGYPDGAFKGAQPATRYEVASVVARSLVKIDAEKASKQDMEMLKKLVMEFKDELDALGVKVDGLDKRVAVIEDNLGGWKLRGSFLFDARFGGGDHPGAYSNLPGIDTQFAKERFFLDLSKQIDENTSFFAQFRAGSYFAGQGQNGIGDMPGMNIRDIYLDSKLPYDIDYRVGRFFVNFESDHGLYIDNNPLFGNYRVDGFQFKKNFGNVDTTLVIGRNTEYDTKIIDNVPGVSISSISGLYMNYVADIFWQPNEKFYGGFSGNWMVDDELGGGFDASFNTYNVYASFNLTQSIAIQGSYYWQNLGDSFKTIVSKNDTPKAWKAVLDVKQSVLKFTALRLEYAQHDNSFIGPRDPYSFGVDSSAPSSIAYNMPWNEETSKFFFVYASQKWNDKWSSFVRYQKVDFGTTELDDASGYGVGVIYQYTPAVAFRLVYDKVDYGDDNTFNPLKNRNGSDHVVQFRTTVSF